MNFRFFMVGDNEARGAAAIAWFQNVRAKAEKLYEPFMATVKTSMKPIKQGYDDFEKQVLDRVNPEVNGSRKDYDGPLNLGVMSINTPTITPKMTSYFIHSCTVSAIAFTWTLLTGFSPKLVIATTAFVLFEPFCEKVFKFKEEHPKAFSLIWGASWVGMSIGHEYLFSTSLRITNNIFKREVSAGVSFLIASAAMSYLMMMPVERVKTYIQKVSSDTNQPADQNVDGGEAAVPATPVNRRLNLAATATPAALNTAARHPLTTSKTHPVAAADSPSDMSGSVIASKPPYTPVLCYIEGIVVDKVLGYIGKKQSVEVQNCSGGCEK